MRNINYSNAPNTNRPTNRRIFRLYFSRKKRVIMKTININGKEYTKDEFFETISIDSYYDIDGCFITDDITEDFWDSQNKDFPRIEPQPPTVRPMSELPEGKTFDFIAIIERKDNGFKFYECMERNEYLVQGSHEDFSFFQSKDYENEEFKMLGWLYKLPNPEDVKL